MLWLRNFSTAIKKKAKWKIISLLCDCQTHLSRVFSEVKAGHSVPDYSQYAPRRLKIHRNRKWIQCLAAKALFDILWWLKAVQNASTEVKTKGWFLGRQRGPEQQLSQSEKKKFSDRKLECSRSARHSALSQLCPTDRGFHSLTTFPCTGFNYTVFPLSLHTLQLQ